MGDDLDILLKTIIIQLFTDIIINKQAKDYQDF